MNKFKAQQGLTIVWFINGGIIITILVLLSLSGRFGAQSNIAWTWVSENIIPTFTLIIGTFTASLTQRNNQDLIDKFFYRLALFSSLFYFLILYIILIFGPAAAANNGQSFADVLSNSKVFLNVIQGSVSFVLGLFFIRKHTKDYESSSGSKKKVVRVDGGG
ncbi:MAG: hypothetical protein JWP45_2913 [Mucilaginibacter sp.]|nr:hypothetical protein [Mucilaginibacter sp.]